MSQTESLDAISIRDQNEHTVENHQGDTSETYLYRFINTLDAEVHVTLNATDDIDGPEFNETESLPLGDTADGDPDGDTKLIAAGNSTKQVESALLEENWPWVEFGVTAQSTPTEGAFELRVIEDF